MNFGDALMCLKRGDRVARNGWNGKRMWLSLVSDRDYQVAMSAQGDDVHTLLPWIGMKTADGGFVPWLASQTDILADDWVQVE